MNKMSAEQLLAEFLRRFTLWINDNIGDGDGTQHIRAIWNDDPDMAAHLALKWRQYCLEIADEYEDQDPTARTVQILAFQRFILNLDSTNMKRIAMYIAKNGRI